MAAMTIKNYKMVSPCCTSCSGGNIGVSKSTNTYLIGSSSFRDDVKSPIRWKIWILIPTLYMNSPFKAMYKGSPPPSSTYKLTYKSSQFLITQLYERVYSQSGGPLAYWIYYWRLLDVPTRRVSQTISEKLVSQRVPTKPVHYTFEWPDRENSVLPNYNVTESCSSGLTICR